MSLSRTTFLGLSLLLAVNAQASLFPDDLNPRVQTSGEPEPVFTEAEFHNSIDEVANKMRPFIQQHGAQLVVEKKWTHLKINAAAYQEGKKWGVIVFGGLAYQPELTLDGFQLAICHEFGHHLAGFPFYQYPPGMSWSSSEGQADYFASQFCAKELWKGQDNSGFGDKISLFAKEKCDQTWQRTDERGLCYRSAAATQSLSNLFAKIYRQSNPSFDQPDPKKMQYNSKLNHPEPQCRMDTFFSGSLCHKAFNPKVIPGIRAGRGENSKTVETLAAQYSCTFAFGEIESARPGCWFHSEIEYAALKKREVRFFEVEGNGDGIYTAGEVVGVHVAMKNDSKVPMMMAQGTATAASKYLIPLKDSDVTWQDIAPGKIKENEQPFLFKILPDVACGQELKFDILGKNQQGAVTFQSGLTVGSTESVFMGTDSSAMDIPDGDIKNGGYIEMKLGFPHRVVGMKIKLHVIHEHPSDLSIYIVDPIRQKYHYVDRIDARRAQPDRVMELEYDKYFDLEHGDGTWYLVVFDNEGGGAKGRLLDWSFWLSRPKCQ